MKLFSFFKKKSNPVQENTAKNHSEGIDTSAWTGRDFEFLIAGEIMVSQEDYDKVMTPNSFTWTKTIRAKETYYQVDPDEFSYSWEEPGIQMIFNDAIPFQRAKRIADEVIENIKLTGQEAELITLEKTKVYSFD